MPLTEPAVDPTADEKDALEEGLSRDGLDVTVHGPDGTRGAEAVAEAMKRSALFDASPYTEAFLIDSLGADKLRIAFAGSVDLDPTDPDDRKLFEDFKLGKLVNLNVSGRVIKRHGGWKENAEGETTVTGVAGVKIDSYTTR